MRMLRVGIAVVVAMTAAACATNPVTGKRQISFMSEEQEIQMGRELDADVRREMGVYRDEQLQKYIEDIGMRMGSRRGPCVSHDAGADRSSLRSQRDAELAADAPAAGKSRGARAGDGAEGAAGQ